jgi:hypothetical protein
MSDDPLAVIYSASLWGIIVVPRAQMEVRAPSPNHSNGLESLCVAQVREGAGSDRFAISSPLQPAVLRKNVLRLA